MVKFHVPINKMRKELDEIKARQKQRKAQKGPQEEATNNVLYTMLSDILENQARIMNYLEKEKFKG